MKTSLVSVNIRTLNSEKTLEETLQSVKDQTYTISIQACLRNSNVLGTNFLPKTERIAYLSSYLSLGIIMLLSIWLVFKYNEQQAFLIFNNAKLW